MFGKNNTGRKSRVFDLKDQTATSKDRSEEDYLFDKEPISNTQFRNMKSICRID